MIRFCIHMIGKKALLLFTSLILISGCAVQAAAPATKPERGGIGLDYEIIQPPYQSFIEDAIKTQKQKKAATIIHKNRHAYVLITLGQRPSAGYRVVIDHVEKKKNQIVIHYSEKKPEGMAASVITYPSVVLKFPQTDLPIYVQKKN